MATTAADAGRARAEALLREATGRGDARFRDGQWEAIDALVRRSAKLLVVQRTGWGKSNVYFLATRLLREQGRGPTLIVSPLIALMRDQVRAAARLGLRAETINGTNRNAWDQVFRAAHADELDLLLVSPERLSNDDFVENYLQPIGQRMGLLVVDEAHCISDWGHDFRPDYRRIVNVVRNLPPNLPVLTTTATANDRVVRDIQQQLGGQLEIFRGSLLRESLRLQTIRLPDAASRLAWLAEHVPHLPGSGIVYTLTQRDTDRVAAWLQQNGIDARPYHADACSPEYPDRDQYRQAMEEALLDNRIKVLVATVALGMGFDKPDLGFVVHFQMPGSVVAYYQQVGRAGRAIPEARGILLSGDEDAQIHEFFRDSAFPDEAEVARLLRALENSHDGLSTIALEKEVNLPRRRLEYLLKFLRVEDRSPVIKHDRVWLRTPVPFVWDHERVERLTRLREREWEEMQAYLGHRDCLMDFLARALDDHSVGYCGRCARCAPAMAWPESFQPGLVREALRFIKRSELPLKPRKQIAQGALTRYGLRGNLPPGLQAEEGRALSMWGDIGWGHLVRDGKVAGYFCDELVEAAAEMIRRWSPTPAPAWVTCVPSLRHPDLVPNYAARLARRLGIPFADVIAKVAETQPQKYMQNGYHQCANLNGVFAVRDVLPPGPVLVVDDVVNSRWTMTVLAALLRGAGCPAVFPLALAATGHDDATDVS